LTHTISSPMVRPSRRNGAVQMRRSLGWADRWTGPWMTGDREGAGKQTEDRTGNRDNRATARPDHRLSALARELRATRKDHTHPQNPQGRRAQLGLAFRLATELVAGFVVGAVIGWYLDKWLGTAPWFLLIFFGLGAAAGVMNVHRTARIMQEAADGQDTADGQNTAEEQAGPHQRDRAGD